MSLPAAAVLGGWPLLIGGLVLAGQGLWLLLASGGAGPADAAVLERLTGVAVLLVGLPPVVSGLTALRGAGWGRALGACTGWLYGGFLT